MLIVEEERSGGREVIFHDFAFRRLSDIESHEELSILGDGNLIK
jgi:hypothetical protein